MPTQSNRETQEDTLQNANIPHRGWRRELLSKFDRESLRATTSRIRNKASHLYKHRALLRRPQDASGLAQTLAPTAWLRNGSTQMWRAVAGTSAVVVIGLGILASEPAQTPGSDDTPAAATAMDREADAGSRDKDRQADDEAAEDQADAKAEAEANTKQNKAEKQEKPKPVAGLDDTQMDNAVAIVRAGQDHDLSKRGQAVAVATAMQESKMHVLSSDKIPESKKFDPQGSGSDHDSVGLFQQRPSMGWGSVEECMDPADSSKAFYSKLKEVDGWDDMSVSEAAQEVQGSAFPEAYAQWEDMAWDVVNEVNDKS